MLLYKYNNQDDYYIPLFFQEKPNDLARNVMNRAIVETIFDDNMETRKEIIPYIGSLYSLNYPEVDEVSPEFWQINLQKAVQIILLALAKKGPTVICLEDLHWADPSFLELIHHVISDFRGSMLFLCIYRPTITLFSNQQIKTIFRQYYNRS